MSMTKEEKADLELECAEAKSRCKEVYSTILQLQSYLKTYYHIHNEWRARHERADRLLAEETKLKKVQKGQKALGKVSLELTNEQIHNVIAMAERLGLVEKEEEEDA